MKMQMMSAVGALALLAGVSAASTVEIATWNVGSGQYRNNFLLNSSSNFGGGNTLELGMRTVYRQSAQLVDVYGNDYQVVGGHQTAGQQGAFATHTGRNRWNFDYHIFYSGGVQNLDSLTMTITSPTGNTVTAPSYDMKLANNDNVTGGTPFPGGDSQDPTYFIQDSQNPVFAPWFAGVFDMNVVGTYTFTLTAVEGAETMTQIMTVTVVPAPLAATAGLVGLFGVATVRRRKA
jgi:hypothetical protein